MRKGTVVNLKQLNSVFIFLKNNWCLLLLSLSFILGISFGTFESRENSKLLGLAKDYMQSYLTVRTGGSFLSVFTSSLLVSAAFLVFIFVSGTSVTGITLVPIFTALRGAIFGSLASLLYSQYALKGIAFNALVLIPPTIISVIMMIFAARDAVGFSLQVVNITLPETGPKNLSFPFKRYCKHYLIFLIVTLFSALLDGWLSVKLMSYFNLQI